MSSLRELKQGNNMPVQNKLISNVSYIFLNWGFTTFFTMLFWMILGKTVSPASYGVIATILQISALLSPTTLLGIDIATSKLIPEFLKRKEKGKVQGLINFSFKITVVSSISTAIILIILSPYISNFLKLDEGIILMLGVSVIAGALAYITSSIYYGFQDMKKIFFTNLCGQIVFVISAFALISLGFDYTGAVVAFIIYSLVPFITRFSRKLFKISKTPIIDRQVILKYSVPAFVVVIFLTLFNNTQYIILSSLKTFEVTGLFAVAVKITSAIVPIPIIFSNALFPIISELSVDKKSKSKQSYLASLVFRYSIFAVIPIAFFMIFFSKYLILFFSTVKYVDAMTFIPFLAFGGVAYGLSSQFFSTLYAIGETKKYRNSYIVSTLFYLTSALILTYYLSALGLAISYFLSCLLMLAITFIYVKKHLTIKLPVKCIVKVLFGTAISLLFLFAFRPLITNFYVAAIFVIIASLIYLAVLLPIKFYTKEDLKVLDFMIERTPVSKNTFFKNKFIKIRNYLSRFVSGYYTE